MKIPKRLLLLFVICLNFGCSPQINLPDLNSDYIKSYTIVTVYANHSTYKNTGIFVEQRDFYSFIVTGKASTNPWKSVSLENDGETPIEILGSTIDNKSQIFSPFNATTNANSSGEIRFYVKDGGFDFDRGRATWPDYYKNNSGAFKVVVIHWETKNLDQIMHFLKQLAIQNPDNQEINKMYSQAQHLKTLLD